MPCRRGLASVSDPAHNRDVIRHSGGRPFRRLVPRSDGAAPEFCTERDARGRSPEPDRCHSPGAAGAAAGAGVVRYRPNPGARRYARDGHRRPECPPATLRRLRCRHRGSRNHTRVVCATASAARHLAC